MSYLQVTSEADSTLQCQYYDRTLLHQYEFEEIKRNSKLDKKSFKRDDYEFNTSQSGLYSCSLCPYVNNHKQNFRSHMMTHTGERPYACNLCPYRGTQKNHLDNHMMRHTGEKPFSCHHCSFRTGRKDSLKYHIQVKHNISI